MSPEEPFEYASLHVPDIENWRESLPPVPGFHVLVDGVIGWDAAKDTEEETAINLNPDTPSPPDSYPEHIHSRSDRLNELNRISWELYHAEVQQELLAARLPERREPRCLATFKDWLCPYRGDEDSCNKTVERCIELNGNSDRFVGFVPHRSYRVSYWRTDGCGQDEPFGVPHEGFLPSFQRIVQEEIDTHPINDTSCHYYSDNPHLRCAVNTKCEDCGDFHPKSEPPE